MAMEIERLQDFSKRLRKLRGPKPQPVIAAEVGVGLRTYQNWEEAANAPEWDNLQRLAAVFGVSENYLLYGEEEPKGPQTQLDHIAEALERIELLLRLLVKTAPQAKRGRAAQPLLETARKQQVRAQARSHKAADAPKGSAR